MGCLITLIFTEIFKVTAITICVMLVMTVQLGVNLMSIDDLSAQELLRSVWEVKGDPAAQLDEDCSPTKSCKNMAGITFDGFAEESGTDLRTAWRQTLEREGKMSSSNGTIRDLVLGSGEPK
jgi:hypothetical protein